MSRVNTRPISVGVECESPKTIATPSPRLNNTNSAKVDLMSLGIELDDDLIDRLRKNLGVEKVFQVAKQSTQRARTNPPPSSARTPETAYRNVNGSSSGEVTASSVKPFHKDFSHVDSKYSTSILNELSNRDSRIDPQVRYALDKMIGIFRLQYARSPERFVCSMLGTKFKSNTADSVARMVLKTRFIEYREFAGMIGRVYPSVTRDMLKTLFELISEEKCFGPHAAYHDVVDFWSFLTLLKVATEDARRSFADKQSNLATGVEFWRKSNGSIALPGTVSDESVSIAAGINDSADRMYTRRLGYGSRSKEYIAAHSKREPEDNGPPPAPKPIHKTVAELMGQTERGNPNRDCGGRGVYGSYFNKTLAPTPVASALGSSLKNQDVSPKKKIQAFKRQDAFDYNVETVDAFSSDRVSYLLGHKNDVVVKQEVSQLVARGSRDDPNEPVHVTNSPRKRSVNTVQREYLKTKTSIADALGYVAPPPPPPGPNKWERLAMEKQERSPLPTAFRHAEWNNPSKKNVHDVLGIDSRAAGAGFGEFYDARVPRGRSSSAHRRRQVPDGPGSTLDIIFGNKKTYGLGDPHQRARSPAPLPPPADDYMSKRLGASSPADGKRRGRSIERGDGEGLGFGGGGAGGRATSAPPRSRAVSPSGRYGSNPDRSSSVANLLGCSREDTRGRARQEAITAHAASSSSSSSSIIS